MSCGIGKIECQHRKILRIHLAKVFLVFTSE